MQFDEAKRRIEDGEALVFLDEDLDINHIEKEEDEITWYEGSRGYDQHTSLKMLKIVCQFDGKKFVEKSKVPEEIEKLVNGEWDTVKEWQES